MGASRRTSLTMRATADKIEDTKSLEFNKVQQSSTSYPHLIETEAIENRALSREAGIRLGHRCATHLLLGQGVGGYCPTSTTFVKVRFG
jgi:hypothetical protein